VNPFSVPRDNVRFMGKPKIKAKRKLSANAVQVLGCIGKHMGGAMLPESPTKVAAAMERLIDAGLVKLIRTDDDAVYCEVAGVHYPYPENKRSSLIDAGLVKLRDDKQHFDVAGVHYPYPE